MASKIIQYFTNMLKTDKIYPVTVTKAVYHTDGSRLDDRVTSLLATASEVTTLESTVSQINSNLVANDYVITTDMWVSDSTNEDYPYKVTITSTKYKANGAYSALVLPNGDTPFLSEDELDFKNNMIGDNGWSYNGSVCFWAKDVPTVSIKLRIIGED